MNDSKNTFSPNQTATYVLSVVGFVALVGLGMWLAVYSTRFVPSVVSRIGTAAVYLGTVFIPNHTSLSVVPTASSTIISFGDTIASSTPSVSPIETPTHTIIPAPGSQTSGTYSLDSKTTGQTPYGLPNLSVTITAVGYLATSSANSFVASSTVPNGTRPAVNFTIKNTGTNNTGQWRFSASIPTQSAYIFQSQPQQSLAPGDSIDYTLGFDQATYGTNKSISITANFDNAVSESTTLDNTTSTTITVLGS